MPQNAAWMLNRSSPETVTTNVTRAPNVKRVENAVTNAPCSALIMAMPPRASTKASGVASMNRVNTGANRAKTSESTT